MLDTDAAPWSIHIEARVAGSLDEARLRSAVREAVARHPMGRARKAPTARRTDRQYVWEIGPEPELDPVRVVQCPDDDALALARAELQSVAVPLAESPPLRVRLARHPGGDAVMLNVNHAAADGFGSLRLLRSVARAYAGDPDPVPDIEPLGARDLQALVGPADRATKLRRAALLAAKSRDLFAPPARVAPDGGSEHPGYGIHQLRLSPEQTVALSDARGTVNDVLLAALHLAIADWNDDHGTPARRIGVMVPANLRPRAWREEVVGNLVLPVVTSTARADRTHAEAALQAVSAQTRRIKEGGTAAALIELLRRSPALPLAVKEAMSALLFLTRNHLVDTALLSNLGDLGDDPLSFGREAGDTVEAWFSPPARMPLGVSLGAVTFGRRLHVSFRYRHSLFGADAARRFAEGYASALKRFLPRSSREKAPRTRPIGQRYPREGSSRLEDDQPASPLLAIMGP